MARGADQPHARHRGRRYRHDHARPLRRRSPERGRRGILEAGEPARGAVWENRAAAEYMAFSAWFIDQLTAGRDPEPLTLTGSCAKPGVVPMRRQARRDP